MDLRKISNCDIDCTLGAREQLPSVREILHEYLPCMGSEATKTGQTDSSICPVILSAEEWRQMCRKIIRTHWVNQILQQPEHK